MRSRVVFFVGYFCLATAVASGQIPKGEIVILAGDTDDAIRLAKSIKDIFGSDPIARRAVSQARDAVIQSWLEEKHPLQLTDQERAIIHNPDRYDKPLLRDLTVTFNGNPPSLVLGWEIPPRLWPRINGAIIPIANRIARDGSLAYRRALRVSVKLQDAEMYRANADVDGNITVVFVYE